MNEGHLRVWHDAQVGQNIDLFCVDVPDTASAMLVIETLAQYDLHQFNNKIKPDYCNASGLELYHQGMWIEWECQETGDQIQDLIDNKDEI